MSTTTEPRLTGTRRSKFAIMPVGALFICAVLLALFVIPMRTWLNQRDSVAEKSQQFAAFEDINDALQDEVDVLKTPEGAQEAIRSSLGYLSPGELRVPMLEMPRATANLPDKWPYTVVTNILQVRSAQAIRNSSVEILNPLQP
ncbi:MAG: hypothetical protein O2792_01965 [Actinomycetota bacterium]|nr:hypothetical protein [Actinomycetota bacterium]